MPKKCTGNKCPLWLETDHRKDGKGFEFASCGIGTKDYSEDEMKLAQCLDSFSESEQEFLYDADPNCVHEIIEKWSGIKCKKCGGWYCE